MYQIQLPLNWIPKMPKDVPMPTNKEVLRRGSQSG